MIGLCDDAAERPAMIQCCSCALLPAGGVIYHLKWHEAQGHCVPQILYDRLKTAYGIER
jgi:hypothetical protein